MAEHVSAGRLPFGTSSFQDLINSALRPDQKVARARYDGLCAFAPFWGAATLFSLAGDVVWLSGQAGALRFLAIWLAIGAAVLVIVRPKFTAGLIVLAGLMAFLYALRLPVASNNKTIALFMNAGLLTTCFIAYAQGLRGEVLRETIYEQVRIVARGLLAVMYFYGIFHKINIDFLDPAVSCAVGLYTPLASPFGLGDNIYGKYLAIAATFIIETITIVALYWRRFFAVGLIIGLIFHYIIPISAYSWYMDFSSLVFALYMLSMPKPVSESIYRTGLSVALPLRERWGHIGVLLPALVVLLMAVVLVGALSLLHPDPAREIARLNHSIWIFVWAIIGGIAMVVMTRAALRFLPYEGPQSPRQPLWVHAIPIALFLTCLSPYIGLKTESSINMFSNLHTEGGVSNHLLLPTPPYLFDYQKDVARVIDSSHPWMRQFAQKEGQMVEFALKQWMQGNPEHWVTYAKGDEVLEKMSIAHFPDFRPNLLERKLLIFKHVDFKRPKVCTH